MHFARKCGAARPFGITLPDSVTSIGSAAFYYCTALVSITLPDSVTSIGNYAFLGCSKLAYNEYGNALYLGSNENPYLCLTKAESTSITSCNIHPSTKVIASQALASCRELASITLPEGLTSIDESAFASCYKITSVTIPSSVTYIAEGAFNVCYNITSITVESGNTKYHSKENCLIDTASKVLVIGCKNSIIPTDSSVTSIGSSAFRSCSGLTSISIPNSITILGSYAFYSCQNLTSIHFGGTKAQWNNISKNSSWNDGSTPSITVHCSDGDIIFD